MSRNKKSKRDRLAWSQTDFTGTKTLFSIEKVGENFKITEQARGESHEFDLYGALAYAVVIANRYDSIGDYESEYTEQDYAEVYDGDVDVSEYMELPMSLSYVFFLDKYATPSYNMLRQYVMESIKTRAMVKSSNDHILFNDFVSQNIR